MSNMVRFTAYLSAEERRRLGSTAKEFDCSENYVLRMILRQFYGMGVPSNTPTATVESAERV